MLIEEKKGLNNVGALENTMSDKTYKLYTYQVSDEIDDCHVR